MNSECPVVSGRSGELGGSINSLVERNLDCTRDGNPFKGPGDVVGGIHGFLPPCVQMCVPAVGRGSLSC